MPRIRVLPYGASVSARDLSQALGAMRLRLEGSAFHQRTSDAIINWGRGGAVEGITPTLNSYEAVNNAANKRTAFQIMQQAGVSIPEFTTDIHTVRDWLENGDKVVARTTLRGHSGEGIEIFEGSDANIPSAPLYVKYIPKQQEYRVHVMRGTVIDVQQKRRRTETPDEQVNWQVRNLDGGFIFARENVEVPQMVLDQAILAVEAMGLDFGAVDLIFNINRGVGYVLEINTACGLQGTTLSNYVEAFQAVISGQTPL
jgi:glutathione synthase/RimK-type ligase-like ATP-grasp enzyme